MRAILVFFRQHAVADCSVAVTFLSTKSLDIVSTSR